MAKNITAQLVGGQAKVVEANTPAEALKALGLDGNYAVSVLGESADMDQELDDFDFVSFSEKVKGGQC